MEAVHSISAFAAHFSQRTITGVFRPRDESLKRRDAHAAANSVTDT